MLDELGRLDVALAGEAAGPSAADRAGSNDDPAPAGDGVDDLDRELRALVADVRATRPGLDAGARMRLEDRVQAAKAAPAPRRAPRLTADRRWRAGLALAAIVVVALPLGAVVREGGSDDGATAESASGAITTAAPATADSSSDQGGPTSTAGRPDVAGDAVEQSRSSGSAASTGSGSSPAPEPEPRSAAGDASGSPSSSGASGGSSSSPAPPTTKAAPLSSARRVVRDVRQTVRVAPGQVAAAAARVTAVVQDAGGYLASSEVRERGASAGGTFAVVVPTGRLDATVAALSRIGRPVRLERSATDVTDQATSLDDRLADLRAERSAARLALARTVDPARRAARRRELTLLSSRVAALQGQRDDLRRRTATSTIALRVTTAKGAGATPLPVDDGSWGIGDAWDDAGRVLEVGGGVVLLGGVVVLPLLLLGGGALVLRRRAAGRRRDALIDRA
jgi:hypothetical protein